VTDEPDWENRCGDMNVEILRLEALLKEIAEANKTLACRVDEQFIRAQAFEGLLKSWRTAFCNLIGWLEHGTAYDALVESKKALKRYDSAIEAVAKQLKELYGDTQVS
jgi:hypothetical protein